MQTSLSLLSLSNSLTTILYSWVSRPFQYRFLLFLAVVLITTLLLMHATTIPVHAEDCLPGC